MLRWLIRHASYEQQRHVFALRIVWHALWCGPNWIASFYRVAYRYAHTVRVGDSIAVTTTLNIGMRPEGDTVTSGVFAPILATVEI